MSLFVPLKRTTLHIPNTGPANDKARGHLHVVLNDPCENKKNLLVSICTYHDKCDKTCVLESGHKFIKHKSFVSYFHAEVIASKILMDSVSEGLISYEELFAEKEFELVRAGVLASRMIKPEVRNYFNGYCT